MGHLSKGMKWAKSKTYTKLILTLYATQFMSRTAQYYLLACLSTLQGNSQFTAA